MEERGYVKHKRNDPMCNPWDSQGDEKNAISICIAFCLDFLIRSENITFEVLSSAEVRRKPITRVC